MISSITYSGTLTIDPDAPDQYLLFPTPEDATAYLDRDTDAIRFIVRPRSLSTFRSIFSLDPTTRQHYTIRGTPHPGTGDSYSIWYIMDATLL